MSAHEDKKYAANVDRNTTSMFALFRSMYSTQTPPADFIQSVAETIAYQQSLVSHYKERVDQLERIGRRRKRDETVGN